MDLKTFLEKGYFPKELPPPFTTEFFANFYDENHTSLPKVKDSSRGVNYSCPKLGLARKTLTITNPQHQSELFKYIAVNWGQIVKFYKLAKLSYSNPIIYLGDRAVNPKKYGDFKKDCFKKSYYHRYQLSTDISKFYSTTYTHSIPWALHGKDYSKKNKRIINLGNELDRLLRNTQSAQTIGLPIGPDSSLVIAELLGTAIDSQLSGAIPNLVGHRYVDDMSFYFKAFADAEMCLKELRKIFNHFELKINADKTKISELPIGIEEEWVVQLRKFEISVKNKRQHFDLISFFSLAFNFSKKYRDEFVLTYAIRKIKEIRIHKDNFPLYESMLFKTIQNEAATLQEVLSILLSYKKWVNKSKLKKTLTEIIKFSSPRGYDYELSWALWYAKTFHISLNIAEARLLSKTRDPISLLIILDLINYKLIDKSAFNTSYWRRTIDEDFLWDENWIFAYEISVKGWAFRKFDYIDKSTKNGYFKVLKSNSIKFYDQNLQVKSFGDLTKAKAPSPSSKVVGTVDYNKVSY